MDLVQGMKVAIDAAQKCLNHGNDIPVGCAIFKGDVLLATGFNTREETGLITGHAEINAINEATRLTGDWRLSDCSIFITLEPCPMCAGAIAAARIPIVVYGSSRTDNSMGCGEILPLDTKIYPGICCRDTDNLLKNFFSQKR